MSDYADEQYGYFQQLASSLRTFNTKVLAKKVDAGIAPGSSAMSRWLSPMVAVGGSISSQKTSAEECADAFGDDSIKVIHHDKLHDKMGADSYGLPR
ncbi:hypothetical protein [uncultured Nostoc sp.]|uniref:hypothetical protein n=1 Tax=uncultured Nostoc sp. TaxID=340711 RepID=UPI0035CC487F